MTDGPGRGPLFPGDRGPGDRRTRRRAQNLEMLIGGLGFFAAAVFVATVVAEVRGEPALGRAMLLLVLVVALGLAIRARRRL